MDYRAVDNVGTVGIGGRVQGEHGEVLVVAEKLSKLNLIISTKTANAAQDEKRKNKTRNEKRRERLRKKLADVAISGCVSTAVGSMTEGNTATIIITNGSQNKTLNVNGLNTKEQSINLNEGGNRAGTSLSATPIKDGAAKTKKVRSKKTGDASDKEKSYRKTLILYQCGNEDCRKTWSSAHGWTSWSGLICEFCNGKAKKTNTFEGMIMVEHFQCTNNGCTNSWNLPHYTENLYPECECDECGFLVTSGGAQLRFGRHYWIACQNKDCGIEWEEVSMEKEYTQRCTKCNNPGTKSGRRTMTGNETYARGRGFFGGGRHNIQGCDMCQKLISDGVAHSCIPKRRVVMKVVIENGEVSDRIIATQ